jgi:A/G-specific adenine glycosylase
MNFSDRVIAWQREHGRHDLPWQSSGDPYRIWLSEVMLQQTQVTTAVPYFLRFVERYPDVRVLAQAPIDDVMAAWAGLGYYSRARNLHRCAQAIVAQHGGVFPTAAAALAQLPGIGRSTAAAIAAFAFGERAAILDGNVKRVIARHFGIEGFPGAAPTERRLWDVAVAQLPRRDIEPYTQGLMDLGATVCVRRRPRCDACPLRTSCVAARDGRVDELPAPRPARERPVREVTLAVVADANGELLLERRAPTGIWGGLLSAPEFAAGMTDAQLVDEVERRYGLVCTVERHGTPVRHEFTHFSLVLHPRMLAVVAAPRASDPSTVRWLNHHAAADAGLPAPIRRIVLGLLPDVLAAT